MNIIEGFKKGVLVDPEKMAAVCGSTRLSFSEVSERVNRLSNSLVRLGLGRSDRVAILALNCHRYLELYYGAPQMGAVVVPINFRLVASEVKYIIDHSGSRAVFTDDALAPLIESLRDELSSVEHFISIGQKRRDGFLDYEEMIEAGNPDFEPADLAEGDLLGLFYTSGTTAEPK
ncbi:MAG TPA: AMP-binding protein, partial [Blastocatellia bacterium]|nr:AMP-binding protein [Blastocatellia bacterium]